MNTSLEVNLREISSTNTQPKKAKTNHTYSIHTVWFSEALFFLLHRPYNIILHTLRHQKVLFQDFQPFIHVVCIICHWGSKMEDNIHRIGKYCQETDWPMITQNKNYRAKQQFHPNCIQPILIMKMSQALTLFNSTRKKRKEIEIQQIPYRY